MTWSYLTADKMEGAVGLATDEAAMLSYGRGQAPATDATLRLYTYRAHCALVGRYQSLADEINLDFCGREGIDVGRRPTGGGAIIMGPGQLGIALITRAMSEKTPREMLRFYADGVIAGLRGLGIESVFRSKNDLEVGGRKIAGLGLYLDPQGAVLFHCSVLVDLDIALMLNVLNIPRAKLSDKAASRVEERVTTVSRELDRRLCAVDVREAFQKGFAQQFAVELVAGEFEAAELDRRKDLLRSQYQNDAWVHQRSLRRDARGSATLKTPEGLLRLYVGVHGRVIKNVLITGDFNVLPPGVLRLESALRWCRADPDRIAQIGGETLKADDLGVAPAEVCAAVWQATDRALHLQQVAHPVRAEGSCYVPDPDPGAGTKAAQKDSR